MARIPEEWAGKTAGVILRETRERRGLSLDDAASVTRISKKYLAALEEDTHDKLPNPAYAKGFLRIYAGYLGLSADDVVAFHEAASSEGAPAVEAQKPEPEQLREGGAEAPAKRSRWYIPLFLLIVVVLASQFVGEPDDKATVPQPAPPAEAPVPTPAPIQQPVSSARTPLPGVVTPEGAQQAVSPPRSGVILRLKVTQDSLLTITIDNSFSQQYDLKAGDLIEWKGERTFALDLSNGGGVEAELNGKQLPPLGSAGKPAHVVLGPEEAE